MIDETARSVQKYKYRFFQYTSIKLVSSGCLI